MQTPKMLSIAILIVLIASLIVSAQIRSLPPQPIDPPIGIGESADTPASVLAGLVSASDGFSYMSETDGAPQPFLLRGDFSSGLSVYTFSVWKGFYEEETTEPEEFDAVFDRPAWHSDTNSMRQYMSAHLGDLHVFRHAASCNPAQVHYFVVGVIDGVVVGFEINAVET